MKQKQDNQISNSTIEGDLYFSPTQNIYNGPEDPLSKKSEAEKAVYYNKLGNDKIGMNDNEAIECFVKSMNYDNFLPGPYIGLGTIAYRQKKLNTALENFRKAESLYENFPILADQRQKVKEMIKHILDKQKKPWFMRLF
ncbi:tetratricopeptide repeat protein [Dolichospermum circinale]|uniref:tetratricopeptide repeat protein n=1 Tax=Dolichospermum circinale TaxID=109265 RepID=UPI00040E4AD7|nr:tetratricopeptide repeat protein [Dolichospermum circinale]MDB9484035.1 tetratricopeptide repeat protein [Dolichospermum circinale CS-537/05]MDB9453975.1 tetratricopeptide repeat protein [Dolichospermum circinale CS-541/06]MDB9463150.1 tetratricopeptide repeat protein [Dolichospermum circinale CS-541/04]MDB9473714.1 tetratricopeptide repeat protein [Dolichospermum circinale CS-537/11]MDB9479283.1 tetratricopeptide repeat protein [Dolichospermum circinale CS-537/03]